MTIGRMLTGMMLAAALAACGEQGGELAQDTARRRAAGAGADSLGGDPAAASEQPDGRLPAFVLGDSSKAASAAPQPAADTPKAAAPTPGTPAPAQPGPQLGGWTSGATDRVRTMPGPVVLQDARVGVNQGFDRVVLEFLGGSVPGHRVEYVDRPVRECGSGDATRVAGDAWISITLRGTQAHNDRGQATVQQRERRLEMPVVREMEFTCDFEGVVQVVLGVASPNAYRVTELANPARLIIDIQQ